ncbi:nucleoside triphosphatase YtkD [Staphylococcus devriesei]|nr:nucleoside triphosphatase YtkD [Staphylococcus devriesei]MCE5097680.1 nucleoside triphosphatase YtkD [Staphylococcus devriesei]
MWIIPKNNFLSILSLQQIFIIIYFNTYKGVVSNVKFIDKDNRPVIVQYKSDNDRPNGNHVLAIPIFHNQLLFTQHKIRGIEFPGGKVEQGEESRHAIERELYEETGGIAQDVHYIAQYEVSTQDRSMFKKDVYLINVERLETKKDYLETNGPLLYKHLNDIPHDEQSYLIQDDAILHCLERVIALGYYQE